jgi:hypothetical protein
MRARRQSWEGLRDLLRGIEAEGLGSWHTDADITVPRLIAAGATMENIIMLNSTVRVEAEGQPDRQRTLNIVDDLEHIASVIEEVEKARGLPVRMRTTWSTA